MRLVNTDSAPWVGENDPRGRAAKHKEIFNGKPGTPDNFNLFMHWVTPTVHSPRHNHNFDQTRLPIEMPDNYAPRKEIDVGSIGYFPEATHYGPLTHELANITLNMQFGGASGNGFSDREALKTAQTEMIERGLGTFADGVFHAAADYPGHRQRDAYHAVWEYVNKRPMQPAKQRYTEPVVLRFENFGWIGCDAPGVFQKLLGTFNERGTGYSMLAIDPGRSYRFAAPDRQRILWVTDGSATANGEEARRHAAIQVARGESIELDSKAGVEFLIFELPAFDAPAR